MFCVEVIGCAGAAFWVVFWVVFGCWLGFFGAFGSGLRVFVSLVCMGPCWFLRVVVVNEMLRVFWVSLVDGFLGGFLLLVKWWFGVCCVWGGRFLLLRFWAGFFLVDVDQRKNSVDTLSYDGAEGNQEWRRGVFACFP